MAIKTFDTSGVSLGTGESKGSNILLWIIGLGIAGFAGWKIYEHFNKEKKDDKQ